MATRKPKPSRTPQPASAIAPLTAAQLASQANSRVNAEMAAQAAPIESARARAAAQALADQGAIQASGDAAARLLAGVGPAAQAAYSGAAGDVGSLASGFSAGSQARVAAGQDANTDFTQKQGGTATPTVDTTALHDTLYGLGGYVPGASLAAQGAAAGAYGAALPGIQAMQTVEDQHSARAAAAQQDQQYEQQLIDLAAKRPDLKNQIVDQLYQLELNKLNARLSIQDQALQTQNQRFNQREARITDRLNARSAARQDAAQALNEAQFAYQQQQDAAQIAYQRQQDAAANQLAQEKLAADLQISSQKQRADAQKAANAGAQVDPSASKAVGYLVDQFGTPILDRKGKRIAVTNTGGSGAGKTGGTPQQKYQNAVQDANELRGQPLTSGVVDRDTGDPLPGKYLAKPGQKGVYKRPGYPDRTDDPRKARTDSNMNFAEAQTYLMSTYGITRVKARRALVAGGWKPDGQRPKKR